MYENGDGYEVQYEAPTMMMMRETPASKAQKIENVYGTNSSTKKRKTSAGRASAVKPNNKSEALAMLNDMMNKRVGGQKTASRK